MKLNIKFPEKVHYFKTSDLPIPSVGSLENLIMLVPKSDLEYEEDVIN